jgi:aminoglycoside/choline kinase family phosphotransferase
MSSPIPMAGGGSPRRYFRLRSGGAAPWGKSVIGVISVHAAETRAFAGFSEHLRAARIPVPRLYAYDPEAGFYLVEDLGDLTLCDRLGQWRAEGAAGFAKANAAIDLSLRELAGFQVRGARGLDLSLCFDGRELGGEAFRADLQLFLTHYVPRFVLRPGPGPAALADLDRLVERLDRLPRVHLCHRDFQTRNIMWPHDTPVFIDYQGARLGPLAYDLAAFLYSPDTGLAEADRARPIATYLRALEDEGVKQEWDAFWMDLYAVVLVRRLQALGAYARIAVVEGKPEYLEKIQPALATLRELFRAGRFALGLPALEQWLLAALAPGGQMLQ